MKIPLNKKEKENLDWILSEFVSTHEDSGEMYKNEIQIAKKILKLVRE